MSGCGVSREGTEDPAKAVKEFVVDAVWSITTASRPAVPDASGGGGCDVECRVTFDSASLTLGVHHIDAAHRSTA